MLIILTSRILLHVLLIQYDTHAAYDECIDSIVDLLYYCRSLATTADSNPNEDNIEGEDVWLYNCYKLFCIIINTVNTLIKNTLKMNL